MRIGKRDGVPSKVNTIFFFHWHLIKEGVPRHYTEWTHFRENEERKVSRKRND